MKKKTEIQIKQMLIQVQTASICKRLSIGIPRRGAQRTCCDGNDCGCFSGTTFVTDGSDATIVSDDEFIFIVYLK